MELKQTSVFDTIKLSEFIERTPKELLEKDFIKCCIKMFESYPTAKFYLQNLVLNCYTVTSDSIPFSHFKEYKHLAQFFRQNASEQHAFDRVKLKLQHECCKGAYYASFKEYFCREASFIERLKYYFLQYGINVELEDLKCSIK